MIQGITFDYDGTIAQTSERQFAWFKHWASVNGKTLKLEDFPSFLAFYNKHCSRKGGVQNVYDKLKLPCDMNDRNHPVWGAYTKYKQEHPVPFYPGMRKAILDIWQSGHLRHDSPSNRRVRLAINTTNSWDSIYGELVNEGVIHCIDAYVSNETLRDYHGAGGQNGITKPSKISLAIILGLIDSEGGSTLHVGDTLNDLAASHKVVRLNPSRPETLITVGVSWGYEGRERLEKGVSIPDGGTIHFNYIIDRPEELLPIVRKLM